MKNRFWKTDHHFWTETKYNFCVCVCFSVALSCPVSVGRKGEIVRFLKPFPPPDQRDDKK